METSRIAGSIAAAVIDKNAASPISTLQTTARNSQAALIAISGPMPAGSPVVSAIAGRTFTVSFLVKPVFDIGPIAQLTQPILGRFIQLAFAYGLARNQALTLLRHVVGLAFQYLDQVEAERGFDR